MALFRRYPNGAKPFRIYGTITNRLTAGQEYNLGNIGGIYLPYEEVTNRCIYTNNGHVGRVIYSAEGKLSFIPETVPDVTGYIMYVYQPYI